MAHHDAESAECLVLTYKEGLLSPIAHDLKIRVTDWTVAVDDESNAIEATFDPGSLRVVAPMKEGRENPSALSDRDKREIEDDIREEVLQTKEHPEIRFASTRVSARDDGGFDVEGDLTIKKVTRRVSTTVRREDDRHVAELTLHQPDFGIKPYRAALGTLRIKPDVDVRVSVPA